MCVPCMFSCCVLLTLVYAAVFIWDNGRSWLLGEHSCMDGTPTLRMFEFMLGSLDAKKIGFGHPSPNVNPTHPKETVLTANDAISTRRPALIVQGPAPNPSSRPFPSLLPGELYPPSAHDQKGIPSPDNRGTPLVYQGADRLDPSIEEGRQNSGQKRIEGIP